MSPKWTCSPINCHFKFKDNTFRFDQNGFPFCISCGITWCGHLSLAIKAGADQEALWECFREVDKDKTLTLQVYLIPAANIYANLRLTLCGINSDTVNAVSVSGSIGYTDDGVFDSYLGYINPGDGIKVITALAWERLKDLPGVRSQLQKNCTSFKHKLNAQTNLEKHRRDGNWLWVEAVCFWALGGRCYTCITTPSTLDDTIPEAEDKDTRSVWKHGGATATLGGIISPLAEAYLPTTGITKSPAILPGSDGKITFVAKGYISGGAGIKLDNDTGKVVACDPSDPRSIGTLSTPLKPGDTVTWEIT